MASSSRQTLNAPAEELTNLLYYWQNHKDEGKDNKELDEDRKRERDAYFERWVSHALADDTTNATLFRNKYNNSGDGVCNGIVENIRTYFAQPNAVQTVATEMGLTMQGKQCTFIVTGVDKRRHGLLI